MALHRVHRNLNEGSFVVLEIENGGGLNARFVYFCCLTRSVRVFPLEI